jgi:hypothetical protein
MDRDLLLKNAVSTVRTIKAFEVPVVHSTINVALQSEPPPEFPEAKASRVQHGRTGAVPNLGHLR